MVAGSKYSCRTSAEGRVDIAIRLIKFNFLTTTQASYGLLFIRWEGITLHVKMQTGRGLSI